LSQAQHTGKNEQFKSPVPENYSSKFDKSKCYLNRWYSRLPTFDIHNLTKLKPTNWRTSSSRAEISFFITRKSSFQHF
jgi:hypothetical protein